MEGTSGNPQRIFALPLEDVPNRTRLRPQGRTAARSGPTQDLVRGSNSRGDDRAEARSQTLEPR
jgi:hypothetical protein